jgi:hypothetical protein
LKREEIVPSTSIHMISGGPTAPPESRFTWWPWAVAAAVLLAGVVAFVRYRRSRAK